MNDNLFESIKECGLNVDAHQHYLKASKFFDEEQYEAALGEVDLALNFKNLSEGSRVLYLNLRSITNMILGNFLKVIIDTEVIQRLHPEDGHNQLMKGHAYYELGEYKNAMENVLEAYKKLEDPSHISIAKEIINGCREKLGI